MRYIFTLIITAAVFMQISCKDRDGQKEETVKETETTARQISIVESEQEEIETEEVIEKKAEKSEESVEAEEQKTESREITTDITADKTEDSQTEGIKKEVPDSMPEDEKGIVAYVDGTVRKKTLEEEIFKTNVREKAAVKSRESYKTMVRSKAELELAGMDILRLAPKTTVDLVALYEETQDGKQSTDIKLEEGDLWAQVNSSDESSEFMMDTDIAAAAITGTNFRMSKTGEFTEMKVYHGEVKISNAKDKMDSLEPSSVTDFKKPGQTLGPRQVSGPKQVSLEEWVYIVKNMQKISFDKNGKVISAGEFKASDSDEKTDWVEWNKKRDRIRGLK
ncbi:MAG: FecR family protein [Candidatus Delongbacteria bacterium]